MWIAAALGSALLFGFAGWWMKVSQMQGGSTSCLLLGLYISGAAGFGVHAALERSLLHSLADWKVWAAGLLIGAGSALGNALFMKALECGPASLTSPLTNMNIILVIALGTFAYGEQLSGTKLAGVALLLLAIVFVSLRGSEKLSIVRNNWYLYVALSIVMLAVRNGGLKVTDELGLASAPVLFASYALSALWFAAAVRRDAVLLDKTAEPSPAIRTKSGGPLSKQPHHSGRLHLAAAGSRSVSAARVGMRWGLVAGLFSYGGLQLYAVALKDGQASIAGPIFAANSLVVAAGAIILYRERLTKLQWPAFALTFAGLALIRL